MTATRRRHANDGVSEREQLLDYLTDTFGERWFLTSEVAHLFWTNQRAGALCASGLLARRELDRYDPRRLVLGPSNPRFEYRVVNP